MVLQWPCVSPVRVCVVRCCHRLSLALQAFSYVSPRAILRSLLQGEGAPRGTPSDLDDRIAAFRRYIAEKERRQALEAVPEFPPGLTWFNSPPLKLSRWVGLRDSRGRCVTVMLDVLCCSKPQSSCEALSTCIP